MKIKDLIDSGQMKQGSIDIATARSLMKQSELRIADLQTLPISEDTAAFRFENAYEAMREAIQAFMAKEGLKPYSHEATIQYAREKKLLSERDVNKLDRYREIRNDITYRGEITTIEETKEAITFSLQTIHHLKKIF